MNTRAHERESFLARQREISRQHYDDLHSLHYDELWGEISPLHGDFLDRLIDTVPRGRYVLDAACGTGKYWPTLVGAGLQVFGIDQSIGMLSQARQKHPQVRTRLLALQDLATTDDLATWFEAVICVDSMEFVGPEDWPRVLTGFARVLRPGGRVYLTVGLPELEAGPEDRTDPRQVPGESIERGGYRHYPRAEQVLVWLDQAGFVVEAHAEGEWYWHLLIRLRREERA